MAVFWIQHYYALPIILEDRGMGDEIPYRRQPELIHDDDDQSRINTNLPYTTNQTSQPMEFANYPAQTLGQQRHDNPSSFNMVGMANMLPEYQQRGYGQQPFQYQLQHGTHFAGQNAPMFSSNYPQQYAIPNQQTRQSMQYSHYSGIAHSASQNFGQSQMQHQQAGLQNMTHQYMPQSQPFFQQPPSNYAASYAPRGGRGHAMGQMPMETSIPGASMCFMQPQGQPEGISRQSSDASLKVAVPRGPPRKPKQSGHALWVGNLPPGTNVVDLKDHFSRDATTDIESVFLISKSNCAFVNYKTDTSCAAAMSRFHDSRFQGVRLVCRLRRGSTPASPKNPGQPGGKTSESSAAPLVSTEGTEPVAGEETTDIIDAPVEKVKEKYFIVKSLTIEDLELSSRNGTWATQAHNEKTLNQAYHASENVYLVFSANKSGEYFGYARMTSAIDDNEPTDPNPPAEMPPQRHEQQQPDPSPAAEQQPITIPTLATATAPKGHIIDDSARGTIFWEAETEEGDGHNPEDAANVSGGENEDGSPNPQAFGKPFKIEWISTERLPFYRTRGLRNPWNSNREVKIARDGTELEPSVGRRLVGMFHRPTVVGGVTGAPGRLMQRGVYQRLY